MKCYIINLIRESKIWRKKYPWNRLIKSIFTFLIMLCFDVNSVYFKSRKVFVKFVLPNCNNINRNIPVIKLKPVIRFSEKVYDFIGIRILLNIMQTSHRIKPIFPQFLFPVGFVSKTPSCVHIYLCSVKCGKKTALQICKVTHTKLCIRLYL